MRIGAKEIFDIDLIAGAIVAFIYDYIWTKYLMQYIPWHFDFYGIDQKDFVVLVTLIIFVWLAKGRMRKILLYAFFFDLYFQLAGGYWLRGVT